MTTRLFVVVLCAAAVAFAMPYRQPNCNTGAHLALVQSLAHGNRTIDAVYGESCDTSWWHGHFYAIKRSDEMERASSRLFDVPAHLYKRAVSDAAAWLYFALGNRKRAFLYETRLHFFIGFFRKRRRDYLAAGRRGFVGEIINFVRSLASKEPQGGIPKRCG